MEQEPKYSPEDVKRIRKELKLDQEAFGEKLGVSRQMVSSYENGVYKVTGLVELKLDQLQAALHGPDDLSKGKLPLMTVEELNQEYLSMGNLLAGREKARREYAHQDTDVLREMGNILMGHSKMLIQMMKELEELKAKK